MANFQIRLNAQSAVGAAVLLLGYVGYRAVTGPPDLDEQGLGLLRTELHAEYTRRALDARGSTRLSEDGDFLRPEDIAFGDIDLRGRRSAAVVRVEVEPTPHEPSGVEHVRYYEMRHSVLTGWSLQRETRKWVYRTTVF